VRDELEESERRNDSGRAEGLRDEMETVALGLALSGRHLLERVGPADAFDVPRCGPSKGAACPKDGRSPLFGIENERPDFIDLSSGMRVNVWRDVLIAFAGVVVSVNDDGLRADLVPLVGMEGSF